ncbi:putative hemolysin [Rahnella sp. PAMC25617]|jgi:hypothetical protein|uniref:putative hemolysin n=1 Tax=Rahnella TaxID=34037 RepID=UPI00101CFAF7|nr:DUF333 domain-containing protein [Rahnella variigena]RYJ18747.1 DUF333 domain-containing protein [Rahnella variigena]
MKKFFFIIMVSALAGCVSEHPKPERHQIGMANPAAVYCHEKGGRSVSVQTPHGVRADCVFADGRGIDEWELYRRDHG